MYTYMERIYIHTCIYIMYLYTKRIRITADSTILSRSFVIKNRYGSM